MSQICDTSCTSVTDLALSSCRHSHPLAQGPFTANITSLSSARLLHP